MAGTFTLVDPSNSAINKQVYGQSNSLQPGVSAYFAEGNTVAGVYTGAGAVNAFCILASTGNITSGTVRVYGLAK
jgi:hypothetical protein